MSRISFTTRNVGHTKDILKDFREAGITHWKVCIIAGNPEREESICLHLRDPERSSDLLKHGEIGATLGFGAACFLALWMLTLHPFGQFVGRLAYAGVFGFFTLFGTWVGGLTGFTVANESFDDFQDQLEDGQALIIIDVSLLQHRAVRRLMEQKYPDSQFVKLDHSPIRPLLPYRENLA